MQPGKLESIANRYVEVQALDTSQDDELHALQKQLSETKTHIKNLMTAIEQGIVTKTTKKWFFDLEASQEQIEYDIEECSVRQPELTERDIRFLLSPFQRETNEPLEDYTEKIIKTSVNSVQLFDDHIVVAYNLVNEKNELESSFLKFLSDPENANKSSVSECSDLELFGGDDESRVVQFLPAFRESLFFPIWLTGKPCCFTSCAGIRCGQRCDKEKETPFGASFSLWWR